MDTSNREENLEVAYGLLLVELTQDPARAIEPKGWKTGPLPVVYTNQAGLQLPADRRARATYFHRRVTNVLYGTEDENDANDKVPADPKSSPVRWHLDLAESPLLIDEGGNGERLQVVGMEILRIPEPIRRSAREHQADSPVALGIFHLRLPAERTIEALAPLLPLGQELVPSPKIRTLVETEFGSTGLSVRAAFRRAGTVVLLAPQHDLPESPLGVGFPLTTLEQWLWLAASATPPERFRPDPDEPLPPTTPLSSSWRCLVLRDGIGFVARQGSESDEFLRRDAPVYVRTLYLDTFLLGNLQRLAFDALADDLSEIDWAAGSQRLRLMERRLSSIRNAVWGAHVTSHQHANAILQAYQGQHDLPALLEEIQRELSDAARIADLTSARRIEVSLAILAAVSSVAGLGAIWTTAGAVASMVVLAISLVILGLILWIWER